MALFHSKCKKLAPQGGQAAAWFIGGGNRAAVLDAVLWLGRGPQRDALRRGRPEAGIPANGRCGSYFSVTGSIRCSYVVPGYMAYGCVASTTSVVLE